MNAAALTLSPAQIAFITGDVTMYVAAADADLTPHIARGAGCRVDATGHRIAVLLSASRAADLLAAVRAQRTLAVVFTQPGNHTALQLKTHAADIVETEPDDIALLAAYRARIIAHIAPLGFTAETLRAVFTVAVDDIAAVHFTPHAAFDQTPGPNAGSALPASATRPA